MDLPVVTPENYYSPEMNMAYMGSTQFKAFEKCEAAALAELRGEYTPPTSQAFLVGGYIDAWFSGELPLYQAQHPEIFKRDGTLKAEYVKATEIVARLQADELYSMLMSGKKQVIRTGVIADVPFKVKIDSLLDTNTCNVIANRWPHTAAALGFCDGAIVDQKIMRDTAEVWSEEDHCRLPFVEAYGYDLQGAIYQAIEGHFLPFILAVGTKEDAPDLAALYINDDDLAAKLAEVEDRAPRYGSIEDGKAYIIRPIFERALSDAGYSTAATLSHLKEAGLIETRGRAMTKCKRINGVQTECICLTLPLLSEDEEESGEELPL